jgi:signal transduction histidine kinase
VIFQEGNPGDGMYLVRSGAVQISALVGKDQRQVLTQLPPGEIFGEMAVLDDQPRSASASAIGDTEVIFIPRETLRDLVKEVPTAALRFMQEISGRLRDFNRYYIREVLQAERMAIVGRFASSIVHDLKNPLTIISIAAETASHESSTPESRSKALERLQKQIERITTMVNDILEFTRGGSGEIPFMYTDYAGFIRPLVQDLQSELSLKQVTVELENQPPTVKVPINPKRLMRVFYNLCGNAVDAMPGGGKVRLAFSAADSDIITEIKDTGPGIPTEVLDKLFEPFVTYGKVKGTGLGLSICRRIVEEHGGKISARNVPGGGAVFTFSIPRSRS